MKKYEYNVILDTELGEKLGTMQILINENKVEGFLNLLKHSEPFYGSVATDGSLNLHGKIVTLIRELAYIATGRISGDALSLRLQIGAHTYLLKGFSFKR